jgi:hypothetical protein
MLGLAVGIDYALFILTRYRQNLGEGMEHKEAAARATATTPSATSTFRPAPLAVSHFTALAVAPRFRPHLRLISGRRGLLGRLCKCSIGCSRRLHRVITPR